MVNNILLTEKEAAEYIGMSCSFLRQDRINGARKKRTPGPSFIKLGAKKIRYLKKDLDSWLEFYINNRNSIN